MRAKEGLADRQLTRQRIVSGEPPNNGTAAIDVAQMICDNRQHERDLIAYV